MNVLYYSEGYSSHDYRFLSAFSAKNWTVEFLTQKSAEEFSEQRPFPRGIRWQRTGATTDNILMTLRDKAKSCAVSLAGPLHSCAWEFSRADIHPWMAASWAYDLLDLAQHSPEARERIGQALGKADAFLCDARTVSQAAGTYRTWSEEVVVQIPWGIDLSVKQKRNLEIRDRLGWDHRRICISTRSWAAIYDPMTVLRAFAKAFHRKDDLRLIMLGDGPLKNSVQTFVKENGLEKVIYFPGRIHSEEVMDWLAAADLYISASSCDGTSISLLEAMDCGLPLLVTDIPSNREWIKPEENGWLFPVGDAATLADKIIFLSRLEQPVLEKMAGDNRQILRERADWRQNADRLTNALESLAAKGIR